MSKYRPIKLDLLWQFHSHLDESFMNHKYSHFILDHVQYAIYQNMYKKVFLVQILNIASFSCFYTDKNGVSCWFIRVPGHHMLCD